MNAYQLKTNLQMGVYEDALKYLVGGEEEQRGLKLSTLEKYNVGLGPEKFTNDDGVYQAYDSVYFPMYAPKNSNKDSRLNDK